MKNINDVFNILILKSRKIIFIGERKLNSLFRQGSWSRTDFRRFLNALFSNKKRPYCILSDRVEQYFCETDFNQVENAPFSFRFQAVFFSG